MLRKYEACFLFRPELTDEDLEKEVQFVETAITKSGGEIVKKELWGRRSLTYPIAKKTEAVFYLFYFQAPPGTVSELKAALRNRETLLRHMVLARKTLPEKEVVHAEPKPE